MNNPSAKVTCFIKHSIPCPNFHHTLFIVGRVQSCDPYVFLCLPFFSFLNFYKEVPLTVLNRCKRSREQHLKRHKEIAKHLKTVYEKADIKPPIPTVDQIAEAVHNYPRFFRSGRTNLDIAMTKDVELRKRLGSDPKKLPASDAQNAVIREILARLGINSGVSRTKKFQACLNKLIDSIMRDIDNIANESRETMKRQLGFYYYCDERSYHRMVARLYPNEVEQAQAQALAPTNNQAPRGNKKGQSNQGSKRSRNSRGRR